MHFELYLAVGGEAFDAAGFVAQSKVAGGRIINIGQAGAKLHPTIIVPWTVWESRRIVVADETHRDLDVLLRSNFVGREIKELLSEHLHLTSLIRRTKAHCWVKILCRFQEGEEPRGFQIDEETIQLAAKFHASIDFDAVYEVN